MKRGFNILIEQEYIDILKAYGQLHNGDDNLTAAFRTAMNNLYESEKPLLNSFLILIEKERKQCLKSSVHAAENTTSAKNSLKSASIANTQKNAEKKKKNNSESS